MIFVAIIGVRFSLLVFASIPFKEMFTFFSAIGKRYAFQKAKVGGKAQIASENFISRVVNAKTHEIVLLATPAVGVRMPSRFRVTIPHRAPRVKTVSTSSAHFSFLRQSTARLPYGFRRFFSRALFRYFHQVAAVGEGEALG